MDSTKKMDLEEVVAAVAKTVSAADETVEAVESWRRVSWKRDGVLRR